MKFFKCKKCGKIIALVNEKCACPTFCCGEPMEEIKANTEEAATEKHIPVFKLEGGVLSVEVGSTLHPMLDAHFIEWIFVRTKNGNQRAQLKPGQEPKAKFAILEGDEVLEVYAYCNLHGLWKA